MASCYRCGAAWDEPGVPGFKNLCHGCGMPLHACRNCAHYVPRGSVRCVVDGAPRIRDPQATNQCRHFRWHEDGGQAPDAGSGTGGAPASPGRGGNSPADPDEARRAWKELFGES